MSDSDPRTDPALAGVPELDPCGCCDGVDVRTPLLVSNRAGLSAINYRAGTHDSFLQTLLARLATSNQLALRGLTTRDADDFSIALCDAWATVGDVITFYQERIANELYLRTAVERVSLVYLARLIGYKLQPGLAAETVLAFMMEDAPGAPASTQIVTGAQVQSVPEPGQQPQTFETVQDIEARPAWNALRPRRSRRFALKDLTSEADRIETLILQGVAVTLKPGDVLLRPVENGGTTFGVVLAATQVVVPPAGAPSNPMQIPTSRPEPPKNVTMVQIRLPDPSQSGGWPKGNDVIAALSPDEPSPPLGSLAQAVLDGLPSNKRIKAADLEAMAKVGGWRVQDLFDNIASARKPAPRVWLLKTRAAIFGHNAPSLVSLAAPLTHYQQVYDDKGVTTYVKGPYAGADEATWVDKGNLGSYPDSDLGGDANTVPIPLDNVYGGLQSGSYLVLRDGDGWGIFAITGVREQSLAKFTLTGKVSVVDLGVASSDDLAMLGIRTTTAWGEPSPLMLDRQPMKSAVSVRFLDLEGLVQGLHIGQLIVLTGELDGQSGVTVQEAAQIAQVEYDFSDEPYTRLTLDKALSNHYVRQTVTINANAARATHGESKAEILGSGDSSQSFQRFSLKQPPLTTISAATPEGRQSTLQVRVNGLLWTEVPTLYGHGPQERIYTTRQEDEGTTTVQFGDGQTGARVPTGRENIRADYRRGTGVAGQLKADQISLLMTRPPGVRSASNPLPATNGQDPDSPDQIRQNAPLPMLTLNRIVSLQDYEHFARAFPGIGKALASWTWDGQARGIFVTVAGPDGEAIADDSVVGTNLVAAMLASGDPHVRLQVKTYRTAFFRLTARVMFLPEYTGRESSVLAAIEDRLRRAFSFAARAFGQPVDASEVVTAIQNTPGVLAVTVANLYRSDEPPAYHERLEAAAPLPGDDLNIQAAELLTLDPAPLDLGEMT